MTASHGSAFHGDCAWIDSTWVEATKKMPKETVETRAATVARRTGAAEPPPDPLVDRPIVPSISMKVRT
jgi:hypothetical protein